MSTCVERGCPADGHTRDRCDPHYRMRLGQGFFGYRDAGPSRRHLAALRELGWTWQAIADEARLSTYVAHRVGAGQTRHVWPESEEAILAIRLVPYGSHRGVDPTGTRRRVQALAWMGWSCADVAVRAGIKPLTLRRLIQPDRRISFDLAHRVAAVYEELCMTPGPNRYAASKARKLGFSPPLAWDEGEIDDPAARPKRVLVRKAAA